MRFRGTMRSPIFSFGRRNCWDHEEHVCRWMARLCIIYIYINSVCVYIYIYINVYIYIDIEGGS